MRYSHRNGETEPPTTVGDFGFDGVIDVNYRWAFAKCGILCVRAYDNSSILHIDFLESDQKFPDHVSWPNECAGRWWGPITGPWSSDDA